MDSKKEIQHVYLVGAKSLGAYGGYETFVYKLTEYHQNKENIKYHVACKANGDGCMDETKFDGVTKINDHEFEFHNAHCFKIDVPQIGPAQAIYYDVAALKACCEHIKENHIPHPIVYIMACRIGPFAGHFYREIHKLGGTVFLNPDGHEWMRAKWSAPIRKYWKISEQMMVKYCDLTICDSVNTRVYLMPVYEAAKRSHSIGEYLNSSFHAFTWTTDYVKDMEPLFPLLVLIVTKITGSLYCVQTILELCVILPLYVAVRKDKNTSLGMAMFVFCMAFYNPSMNMMRQSIAMSLGVLGFEYWKNAEKKNAFICVIIAFLFHTSSLLILLIYLLYDYIVKGTTLSITGNNVSKRNETPRMLISMGIGFVVMIMMSAIVSALSAVGFGEYVSYVTGKLVFMPNQLLIRIPQIILIIWSYRYLRKDGEDISFFLVMEVYAVLFSQFTSVSGYGGRIALYFAIFEVLVISQAMSALKPRKSGIIIRPLIIGYYMFYWWYYFVFVGAHQTVPYIFMR